MEREIDHEEGKIIILDFNKEECEKLVDCGSWTWKDFLTKRMPQTEKEYDFMINIIGNLLIEDYGGEDCLWILDYIEKECEKKTPDALRFIKNLKKAIKEEARENKLNNKEKKIKVGKEAKK